VSRKAKDLDTLIRLNKWTVDERQRELGVLQQRESEWVLFGESLDRQLKREQEVAAADPMSAGQIYAVFATNHKVRREQLMLALHHLRIEIEHARDRLAEAYRGLKVYEEVQKNRAKHEQQEEARIEQATLDEIGQIQHQRKKK
jgi:flagellar export protein FliJ